MPKKILVVDDDAQLAKLMRITLETRGYEVILARNGREALDRARSDHPDLLVMDVMMPEMDGFEALQKMKSDLAISHIPVIILTALGRSTDALKGLEAGAHFYLAKPFSPFELIAHARQILEHSVPVGQPVIPQETTAEDQEPAVSPRTAHNESSTRLAPVRSLTSASLRNREMTPDEAKPAEAKAMEDGFAQVLERLSRIEHMLHVLMAAQTETTPIKNSES